MISRKQESIHEPAGMQKRFGLLCMLEAAAIVLLTLNGTQATTQEPETSYSVLYTFCPDFPICRDGAGPNGLIRDEDGNLYGTTDSGGSSSDPHHANSGAGVVFKLDREGKETVLYNFTGGADGADPFGSLIRDERGNLYGTTVGGGDLSSPLCAPFGGCGAVFKLDPSGKFTLLYSFTGGADGAFPGFSVIRDEDGNLYGTTFAGGSAGSFCPFPGGCGVVFKLDPSGKEAVLYDFCSQPNCADGGGPVGVIRDEAGNLYGVAGEGGSPEFDAGLVFKLDREGKETVLYRFTGGADGGSPNGPLVRDAAGNLYGTTPLGGDVSGPVCGSFSGCGVVFKLSRRGKFTVLYTFTGGADGARPLGGLTLGDDGFGDPTEKLYGTTSFGGYEPTEGFGSNPCFGSGCGVVFKVDRWGKETVLHTFQGSDGLRPGSQVLVKHHRSLYGTAGNEIFKIKLDDDDDHHHHHDHEWDD